jgi:hypothetical protein
MTWDDLLRTAPADQGPFGDHLKHYRWKLRDEPELRDALKQVIRRGSCSDEMLRFRLLRAGLIRDEDGGCACRCELYRMYFEDKL